MTNTENSSSTQSHGKLIAVVVAAAVVIILAVLSAFVWPGWAIGRAHQADHRGHGFAG